MQKKQSDLSMVQQKFKVDPNKKYTPKEAMAIAIAAMNANEINRNGRISEKARADAIEEYVVELMGVIQEQQNTINNSQPEDETEEEFGRKLNDFMVSEDPRTKEIEEKQIQQMKNKQLEFIRSMHNYTNILSKK
jgi:hypothetical protein